MNIRQKLCDQEKTVRRATDANKRKGHNGITQTPGGDACNIYVVDPLDGGTESNKPPEEFNLELVVGMAPSCLPPPPHGYTTGSSTSANELSKHKRITLSVRVYTVFSFFVFKFANEKRITNSFFVFRFQICERKTKNEFLFRFSFSKVK